MTKAIVSVNKIPLWKNQNVDFPAYGIPSLPKFVVPKQLRGMLVVTPDVKKAWIKHHLVGEALDEKPISQRARDWFWRAAMLAPKTGLPAEAIKQVNRLREQLLAEFSEALESGKLQRFVRSLDEALKKPVTRHDLESEISEFLIKGWINPAAPFCCFNYTALADLLADVLKVETSMSKLWPGSAEGLN